MEAQSTREYRHLQRNDQTFLDQNVIKRIVKKVLF